MTGLYRSFYPKDRVFPLRAELRPASKTVVKGATFKEWAQKNKEVLTAHFDDKH